MILKFFDFIHGNHALTTPKLGRGFLNIILDSFPVERELKPCPEHTF